VALTVTPALSLILLRKQAGAHRDAWLARGMKAPIAASCRSFAHRPWLARRARAGRLRGTGWVWQTQLGEEFLPSFKERDFLMHWLEKPNTSPSKPASASPSPASKDLHEGARRAQSGCSHRPRRGRGRSRRTRLHRVVDQPRSRGDYDATITKVQAVVDGYPGLVRDLLTFLRERIKEVLTGASASVVVRIFGPDLETTAHPCRRGRRCAQGRARRQRPQGRAADARAADHRQTPARNAALHGLTAGQVRQAVTTLISGRKVGEVYQEQRVHDVTVWSVPSVRADYTTLRELLIETPAGGHVRLADVADLAIVPTPNAIKREGASRRIDVTCNVAGRALGEPSRARSSSASASSPSRGYHPEILGEWAERQAAQSRLLWLSLASLAGILVLLLADFPVACASPCSSPSRCLCAHRRRLAAWLGGGVLSLGSLVGFVTVLGIAARNGILLVSHYRHLETEETRPSASPDPARQRGAPHADPHDRRDRRARPAATRAQGRCPRQRNRAPDGSISVILGGLVTLHRRCSRNLFLLPALYASLAAVAAARGRCGGLGFAMEVLVIGRLQYEALIPVLIASVVGDATCSAWGIHHTVYHLDVAADAGSHAPIEALMLGKVALAGMAFGLGGWFFSELTHAMQRGFAKLVPYAPLRPALGAVLVIALVYVMGTRDYLGLGVEAPPGGQVSILASFEESGATPLSWLWKTIFTSVTLSSGFKGGEVKFGGHVGRGFERRFAARADVRLVVEEGDEVFAQLVVARVFHDLLAVARALEGDLQNVADLGLGAVGHHHHTVGEEDGLIDIMRDHERGDAVAPPEFEQHLLQFVTRERVQHAEGLVEQQHLGLKRKRTGDADTLAHTLGEFSGVFVHRVAQTDNGEIILGHLATFGLAGGEIDLVHTEHDVFKSRHPRQQTWRLKHDATIRSWAAGLTAGEDHVALAKITQSSDHHEHGALTTTTVTDERGELAFLQFEIEVFDDRRRTFRRVIRLPETIQFEHGEMSTHAATSTSSRFLSLRRFGPVRFMNWSEFT
jgi:hypothetical protein